MMSAWSSQLGRCSPSGRRRRCRKSLDTPASGRDAVPPLRQQGCARRGSVAGRHPHARERGAHGARSGPLVSVGRVRGIHDRVPRLRCRSAGCCSRRSSSSPSGELLLAEQRLRDAIAELVDLTQAAGAVVPDITAEDVALLFEQLQAVRINDKQREVTLSRRYLELYLQALQAPGAAPLPGPPPTPAELLRRRYDAR